MSASVVTVVQARSGSTRLPGKVLRLAGGETILKRQLDRMRASRNTGTIVVATTTESGDDPIVDACQAYGVAAVRGHPTDLLDRHYQAATTHQADVVVKIPSDCPLIDPAVIDQVIAAFESDTHDFVSNLHPPSWPDGNDVEVMTIDALEQAHREASQPFEREHTTPFIWERPDQFRIHNVEYGRNVADDYRLTIDYPADLLLIDAVYRHLEPLAPVEEVMAFLDANPTINALNGEYRKVNWYRHHLAELKTVTADDTKLSPDEIGGNR